MIITSCAVSRNSTALYKYLQLKYLKTIIQTTSNKITRKITRKKKMSAMRTLDLNTSQ